MKNSHYRLSIIYTKLVDSGTFTCITPHGQHNSLAVIVTTLSCPIIHTSDTLRGNTKDIFIGKKTTYNNYAGAFWQDYLATSTNKWERLAAETGYAFKTNKEKEVAIIKNIYEDGSHVSLKIQNILLTKAKLWIYSKTNHLQFSTSAEM